MKRLFSIFVVVVFGFSTVVAQAVHKPTIGKTGIRLYNQPAHRTEIILPQVKGYNLYKGDFHVHTIYSDGEVTPRERVREAWYDGLDIIALTDHLEARTYEKFMLKAHAPYNPDGKPYKYIRGGAANKTNPDAPIYCDLDAAYDEAILYAEKEEIPIMVIRGTEIWRKRDIGEYNALFLKDITDICNKDLFECFRRVKAQGGMLFHNHPGAGRNTVDKSEIQEKIYGEKWIDGIEVVGNGPVLFPKMIDRCVDEKLTIFANTDVHRTSAQHFPRGGEIHRTMTFVLAKECTEKAIKDALLKRRTIGYAANNLIGEEMWLAEFLNAAVECKVVAVNKEMGYRSFELTNHCSVPFILCCNNAVYTLNPFRSVRIDIDKSKKAEFLVENMWSVGDKHPTLTIDVDR